MGADMKGPNVTTKVTGDMRHLHIAILATGLRRGWMEQDIKRLLRILPDTTNEMEAELLMGVRFGRLYRQDPQVKQLLDDARGALGTIPRDIDPCHS
ncbi:hypothetical protein BH23CHL2_BH23CHL2_15890 [soil metagenome]